MATDVERKLPVNAEDLEFYDWQVKYRKSHILHSKCLNDTCGDGVTSKCLLCVYNDETGLPHLPDMVFPNNLMSLKHKNGCGVEFNALDALKRVSSGKLDLKIACSEEWKESRQDHGPLDEVKPFDWTFSTDYTGTLLGDFKVIPTEDRIDMEKLRQKERILFYEDITLFEDELHDNGIAVLSVKVRVMPSSFYILLRYFLRVDNVCLKINDTRLYHEFGTDFVQREYTTREAKVAELDVPTSVLTNSNEVAQFLPLLGSSYTKLVFPAGKSTGDGAAVVKQ